MRVPASRILISLVVAFAFSACKTAPKSGDSKPAAQASAPAAQPAAKVAPAEPAAKVAKKPSTEGATLDSLVSCKSGSDERTIEISKKDGGCSVHYTKAGEAKEIGNAVNDHGTCQQIVDKVRGNLQNAGFACK